MAPEIWIKWKKMDKRGARCIQIDTNSTNSEYFLKKIMQLGLWTFLILISAELSYFEQKAYNLCPWNIGKPLNARIDYQKLNDQ